MGGTILNYYELTVLLRVLRFLSGVILIALGLVAGVLGVWGMDRGSGDAWVLTLIGLLLMAGGGLLSRPLLRGTGQLLM